MSEHNHTHTHVDENGHVYEHSHGHHHSHAQTKAVLNRLSRPEGAPEQGYFGEITQAIKETVSIPVILTGGITDVQAAKELLQNGKADLIGVGRAILKDHISHCIVDAVEAGDQEAIQALNDAIDRFMR